jgi:hypothetical protein
VPSRPPATLAFLWVAIAASCGDPVRDDGIAALGPEAAGVRRGPVHRPGQPCLLCHSDGSEAAPFAVAGTVFVDANSTKPVDGAAVYLIDSDGVVFTASTNCAGNFFVRPDEFSPHYPIWITMRAGQVQREMESPVFREGSCAACHTDPRNPSSAGHVYMIDDPTVETLPPSGCP